MIVPTAGTSPFTRKILRRSARLEQVVLGLDAAAQARVAAEILRARAGSRAAGSSSTAACRTSSRDAPARRLAGNAGRERGRRRAARDDVALLVEEHVARRGSARLRARRPWSRGRPTRDAAARSRRRRARSCSARRLRARQLTATAASNALPPCFRISMPGLRRELCCAGDRGLAGGFGGASAAASGGAQQRDDEQQSRRANAAMRSSLTTDSTFGSFRLCGAPRRVAGRSRRRDARTALTLPPKLAISRTSVEEMKVNCSGGVRNTFSTWFDRCRLMFASWNSNSKSDTARRPRTTTLQSVLAREVDGEPGVARDLDVRNVAQHFARELDALVEREHRRLAGVRGDRDDARARTCRGAAHQVVVAVGDRVERAGIQSACHGGTSLAGSLARSR